jgi:hypothetical protein
LASQVAAHESRLERFIGEFVQGPQWDDEGEEQDQDQEVVEAQTSR